MKKTPAFLLAALLLGIQPAQAFSVRHDFSVQIGPFDASRTNFEYALTSTEYRVESTVKTNGLFDTLYPFRADYATTGKINGDNMETRSYKYKSQSRFTSRSRELVYDRNGKPLYRLSAKNGKEKKVDILPDAKTKTPPTCKPFLPNLPASTTDSSSAIPAWRSLTANAATTLFSKTKAKSC